MSADIYESIFTESNICEIEVFDTDDALGSLPILGDETINFSFSAPGTRQLDYTFALDKVELLDVTGTQKGKEYVLHGVGQETLQSKTNYVQKSYNTDISSIVQDIHTTFLKAITTLATEATDGIQKLIIPNLKPFEAIDMVRRRATSSSNKSSTFLYFQNSDGHNFKTIEGMLQGGAVKNFVHGDALNTSIFNSYDYNNILDYEVPQIVSSTQRIALGGLSAQTATYDVRTRQYISKVFQPIASIFNSSAFISKYGSSPGIFSMLPIDTKNNPTYIPDSTPQQLSYLSNILQCYVNLKVSGDTTYKAGDVINLNIPQPIAITGIIPPDPLISGNYVISRLRRAIGKPQDTPRYTDMIECMTQSLGNQ